MIQFKYISEITEEELKTNIVIPCTNQDGFQTILIKNATKKTVESSYSTDNLDVKVNTLLSYNGCNYFFHIITSKKQDFYSRQQFNIIYEYIFNKISNSILDNSLFGLLNSIEDYFKTSPEKDTRKLQIGVFGELLVLKNLYDLGYENIVEKYHNNFYSKHDIEISDKVRLEIKTTSSEKRIHRFKHNQIYRTDVKVYVISSMLEPAQEGYSLYRLFEDVIQLYTDSDSILALRKLMKKCGVDEENEGLRFALNKAIDDIYYFDSKDLPKINFKEPKGVSNIEYDVDCSLAEEMDKDILIHLLMEESL